MDNNKQFWQKIAKLYAPFMKSNKKLYADICQSIAPYLNKEMNVLELACGTGQLSYPLSEKVKSWEATDFSEKMIAEAKKKNCLQTLCFSVQDATDLPYDDNSFDAVVISNALHIMPHPEKALAQIKRILKTDGVLFAPTFVHGESTAFHIRTWLMERIGFYAYFKWNEAEYIDFLKNNGLCITETKMLGSNIVPLCFAVAKI
ncbi:MAG: class I SAM-dependent methyltransferase [Clostridia bacterium]|nr:class I SAM-dependent methyltransferase [Clostridia bacterium]